MLPDKSSHSRRDVTWLKSKQPCNRGWNHLKLSQYIRYIVPLEVRPCANFVFVYLDLPIISLRVLRTLIDGNGRCLGRHSRLLLSIFLWISFKIMIEKANLYWQPFLIYLAVFFVFFHFFLRISYKNVNDISRILLTVEENLSFYEKVDENRCSFTSNIF